VNIYESAPSTAAEDTDSSSTQEHVVTTVPPLYARLRDGFDTVALGHGFLARRAIELCSLWIQDEIGYRTFGTSRTDFTRLCRCAAEDAGMPGGMVLVNLERQRTLVFSQDERYEGHYHTITHAMRWMQAVPGTFGLTVQKKRGKRLECVLFAVLFYEEHGESTLQSRAARLTRIVRSWA